MTNGNFSATDAVATKVLNPDEYRAEVMIQHYTGDPVYVGFNVVPEAGKGLMLSSDGILAVTVDGHRARGEVFVICDTGKSATGGVAAT